MNSENQQYDPHFMQLVLSLQGAAMQQMGKVMNPMTSKIERDLAMAQNTIDMLTMLNAKMQNNMTDEEAKLIDHVLYELRLNFVDESSKKEEPAVTAESKENGEDTTDQENKEN